MYKNRLFLEGKSSMSTYVLSMILYFMFCFPSMDTDVLSALGKATTAAVVVVAAASPTARWQGAAAVAELLAEAITAAATAVGSLVWCTWSSTSHTTLASRWWEGMH